MYSSQHLCFILQAMRILIIGCVFLLFYACINSNKAEPEAKENLNYLHDIAPFTSDSLVNVVIEIPAGTNQKWEVNKVTGQIEWEQITPDSLRIINYLPYPANYGFVPQTLLPEGTGGDDDPVDVFVFGPSIARETIVSVRVVGIIHMLDEHESDSKLLAVDVNNPGFDVNSYEMLANEYPGVVDIIKLWLLHYKGTGRVEILSVSDDEHALRFLKNANKAYNNKKNQ